MKPLLLLFTLLVVPCADVNVVGSPGATIKGNRISNDVAAIRMGKWQHAKNGFVPNQEAAGQQFGRDCVTVNYARKCKDCPIDRIISFTIIRDGKQTLITWEE